MTEPLPPSQRFREITLRLPQEAYSVLVSLHEMAQRELGAPASEQDFLLSLLSLGTRAIRVALLDVAKDRRRIVLPGEA